MKHQGIRYWTGVRPGSPLSEREEQVLRLLCEGLGTKKIAHELGLSDSTVETHRAKLMVRTDSVTCVQLGIWAARNGYALVKQATPVPHRCTQSADAVPSNGVGGGAGL